MTKAVVTKLFVGAIVAVVTGLVLGFAAVMVALANGAVVMDGPDVSGIQATPFVWTMVALAVVGIVAMIGGVIVGLVSWIGALLNTSLLDDKTWFVLLLVLGLLSFGVVAMIAYVIAGPDGSERGARRPAPLAT